MSTLDSIRNKFEGKAGEINSCLQSPNDLTNVIRRRLYSDIELIKLDLLDHFAGKPLTASTQDVIQKIDNLAAKLDLTPIQRELAWWEPIDIIFRAVGVIVSICSVGMFLALPIILLRPLDYFLVRNGLIYPINQFSETLKRFAARLILTVAGVVTEVEGLQFKTFEETSVLLTFSHASNLDGYLVTMTCPVRHYALAKKELFLVPLFSWISLAIGGVPVDRENRDRAVLALQRSTAVAGKEKVCVVIAPEGTRSKSGQLLPFKKGAFHISEQLKCPVVPFVVLGAYDIYPVGTYVNRTGKVFVRYLNPILPEEAIDREHMCRLVRRRMLETLADCPMEIGMELTWSERFDCVSWNLCVLSINALIIRSIHYVFVERWHFSVAEVCLRLAFGILFVTFALYVYFVYLVNLRWDRDASPLDHKKNTITDKKTD